MKVQTVKTPRGEARRLTVKTTSDHGTPDEYVIVVRGGRVYVSDDGEELVEGTAKAAAERAFFSARLGAFERALGQALRGMSRRFRAPSNYGKNDAQFSTMSRGRVMFIAPCGDWRILTSREANALYLALGEC